MVAGLQEHLSIGLQQRSRAVVWCVEVIERNGALRRATGKLVVKVDVGECFGCNCSLSCFPALAQYGRSLSR